MNWIMMALKKYATFSGRSQRSEYWFFVLFFFVVFFVLSFVDKAFFLQEDGINHTPVFSGIFGLALLVPAIAVTVRRLHDTDRSGWWYFISLVPLVGPIVMIVFCAQDSKPGDNRFGPNPKGVTA